MAPKRTGAKTDTQTKRARTEAPVKSKMSEKLRPHMSTLVDYLLDKDLSDTACRGMFEQAVPLALGDGAAKDERHAYQESVVSMVDEVLSGALSRWQSKVDEARAAVDAAEQEKTSAVSEKDALVDRREAQRATVQEANQKLTADTKAAEDDKKALAQAKHEVANFSEVWAGKEREKAHCVQVLNECFLPLKAGDIKEQSAKNKATSQISGVLSKLSVEASLSAALPTVFNKEPSARGSFDEMVLDQISTRLDAYITEQSDFLAKGDDAKKEKELAQEDAEKSLQAAEDTKASSVTDAHEAQEKLKELKAKVQDAETAILAKAKEFKVVEKNANQEQAHLDLTKEAIAAFEFLRDRVAKVLEDQKMD